MTSRGFTLTATVAILTLVSSLKAQSTDIDPSYWGYEILDIYSSRGMIEGFFTGLKPLSRERFGFLLLQAERKQLENPDLLSATEQRLLERLKGDLLSDPDSPDADILDEFKERHIYSWSEGESWFFADALLKVERDIGLIDDSLKETNAARTTGGGRIRGYLSANLYFYLWFSNTKIDGDESPISNFDPSQGLPAVAYDDQLYRDDAVSYLKYRAPWFDLTVGRQNIRWGPGLRSGVTLSANNPPMDVVRLDVRYSKLSYSGFIGDIRGKGNNKKIAAHRIDLMPFKGLRIGAGETVIYNRGKIEMLYALPLMPFHIAEHHLGDRDNNALNFDISYDGIENGRVYAELFIDDYKLRKSPLRHWGNKWAFFGGVLLTKPMNLKNSTLSAEYTRVEPYVYTHVTRLNDYFNYDRSIGYWAGPDTDEIFISYTNTPNWRSRLRLSVSILRRGRLDESIALPEAGEEDKKEFLSGVVERRVAYSAGYRFEIFKDQRLEFNAQKMTWDNFGRQAGEKVSDNRFFLAWSVDI